MGRQHESAIRKRLMKHLFSHLKKTAFFNLLLAFFIAFFLHLEGFPLKNLYWWLIAMAIVSSLRFLAAWYAEKAVASQQYFNSFVLSVIILLAMGCVWGYAYAVFYDDISVFMRMFILLIIAGVSAASTVSMAASALCFYAFILPITGIVLLKSVLVGTTQSLSVVFVMLTFVGFLTIVFMANRKMLIDNILLLLKQHELIEELRHFNKKLAIVSITDELTQLANRRHFSERLLADWVRAKRSNLSISLLIIDVDYFKEYNDNYGHLAGDDCLNTVAKLVSTQVHRETDLAARYGGDEFAIILYDTDLEAAENIAQAIVDSMTEYRIKHAYSPIADHVTLSIGISSMKPLINDDYETLIVNADKALYKAKEKGRNTIYSC